MNPRVRRTKAYRETRLASALGRGSLAATLGLFLWPAMWMFVFMAYDLVGRAYGVELTGLIDEVSEEVFFSLVPFGLFLLACAALGMLVGDPFFSWMAGGNDRFGSHGPGRHE